VRTPPKQPLISKQNTTTPPNQYQICPLKAQIMARIRKEPKCRKSRAKHFTPPPEMVHKARENRHPDTPSRASIFAAKATAQYLGKSLTSTQIREITGVPEHIQSRILASNQCRTLHN